MRRPTYVLKTLGCKANLYDSQQVEAELRKKGWVPAADGEDSEADLCLVNSCTVTDDADRQSRKMATRLSKENPGARVVITGCAAEVDPEKLKRQPGVDFVISNRDKPRLVDLVLEAIAAKPIAAELEGGGEPKDRGELLGKAEGYAQMLSRHPIDREWPATASSLVPAEHLGQGDSHRTRAFLKIQDGCNSFCTYCVIPYGRGPTRSLEIAEVVAQVASLVEQGAREVVITGINIGEYGVDWSGRRMLAPLFEAILSQTRLERLRVSSLDPTEIDDDLLSLMRREPRFCPHFHVSLQSPHPRILRLMKRKYGAEDASACLEKISRLPAPAGGAFVGMDVITGFPGETAEEFDWTLNRLRESPWNRLHVFPYSERSGTPATRLPGAVPQAERVRRGKLLRELSLERLTARHREVLDVCRREGKALEGALLESRVPGPDGSSLWFAGYTRNYLRVIVRAEAGEDLGNQVADVHPTDLIVDRNAGDAALLCTR